MANTTVEQGGLEKWLFRLGYASARASDLLQRAREAAGGAAEDELDRPERPRREDEADLAADERIDGFEADAGSIAATTALGVVVAQLLRPRRVDWPRAVLAGTIGTLLYDAETLVEARLRGRKFRTSSLLSAAGDGPLAARLARYAAGIGMASFYARYLYGRLPGPPLVQGLTYGLLESGTRGFGGAVALLNRISPEVRLPTGYTAGLSRGSEGPFELLRRHAAFGLALGLLYRGSRDG